MIAVAAAIGIFCLVPLIAGGQGGQRGRGSKVDLSGPAPRLPNGKPSMSGVWGQVRRADVTDGKLYHLAGLNLSRAWMLEGIVSKLPSADTRRKPLTALARKLRQTGLDSVKSEHYEGGHWLGSFAIYLVSGRGTGT